MPLNMGAHFYQDPLRGFVETMLARLGTPIPPEDRPETVTALMVEAQRRVGLDLMEAMDAGSLKRFAELLDRNASEEEVVAFLTLRVPDHRARAERTLEAFEEECRRALAPLVGAEV